MGSCDYPWSPLAFGERGGIAQCGFWRFLLCGWIPEGEPGRLALVCAIQAGRDQNPLPRTRLSFERKELWGKIDLPCDWLVNF